MSIYENKINNFIHLLSTQPDLFTATNRRELEKLIATQPDEINPLANTISTWCEQYQQVDQELSELRLDPLNRPPGSKKANLNIPQYEHDKKSIINAIQQSYKEQKEKEKPQEK